MKIESPTCIEFATILNAYKSSTSIHLKHSFFEKIIASFECFHEKDVKIAKWPNNSRKIHSNNKQVAPKARIKTIGNSDGSDESVFKKELILALNKISEKNFDTLSAHIMAIFKVKHGGLFMNTLWDYFKLQPTFQHLYIKLLSNILTIDTDDRIIKQLAVMWASYVKNDEWKIEYKLVEDSHNYDDFCEYLKAKKKLNAIAQGWARLIETGIVVVPNAFDWCDAMLAHAFEVDLSNVVYRSMVDSYIEQIREYCKYLRSPPSDFVDKVVLLKSMDIQKSTKFKIMDFMDDISVKTAFTKI